MEEFNSTKIASGFRLDWGTILPWMLFCSVLFGGCGTILTDQGAAVRITNNYGDVMGCRYLGQTTASSVLGGYGFKKKGLTVP